MRSGFLAIGPIMSAVSILAGAFGAHGLRSRLDPAALELWETAARYLMYAGVGVTLVGLATLGASQRGYYIAGWIMVAGAVIFSGTVALLALGGPRWLGAITPLGGVLLVVGFVLFAWTSLRL